jgi:hypothetical protein
LTFESIPEAKLQQWFEQAVEDNILADAIQNIAQLEERLRQLQVDGKVTDQVAREGLRNALDIYRHLHEAETLSANESIALQGYSQMRPDLVLHTSSAHYVLVELKTRSGPERQGVQELLAYSAAIKMAMPYVNDMLYIIVANSWDALLQFSVRSLILDGKRVLPLQWTSSTDGGFKFKVRLDLFQFDFVQQYDPFYALSAATFACTRPKHTVARVSNYFGQHAAAALADCRRMQQCGFILIWSRIWPDDDGFTQNTTLLTLNQHWRESEYLPADFEEATEYRALGIVRVIHKQVEQICTPLLTGSDDGDIDIYRINLAADERSRRFPQNGASYEILQRRRNKAREEQLKARDKRIHDFETGDFANLKRFADMLTQEADCIRVQHFVPFGEFEDFARQENRLTCHRVDDIIELLDLFRGYKGYPRQAETPHTFHTLD